MFFHKYLPVLRKKNTNDTSKEENIKEKLRNLQVAWVYFRLSNWFTLNKNHSLCLNDR